MFATPDLLVIYDLCHVYWYTKFYNIPYWIEWCKCFYVVGCKVTMKRNDIHTNTRWAPSLCLKLPFLKLVAIMCTCWHALYLVFRDFSVACALFICDICLSIWRYIVVKYHNGAQLVLLLVSVSSTPTSGFRGGTLRRKSTVPRLLLIASAQLRRWKQEEARVKYSWIVLLGKLSAPQGAGKDTEWCVGDSFWASLPTAIALTEQPAEDGGGTTGADLQKQTI